MCMTQLRRFAILSLLIAAPLHAQEKARLDVFGDLLPAGAIHRLGTLRMARDGFPALSADGKLVATATDRGIQFWDAATGRLVRDWSGAQTPGEGPLAFSPDGQTL